jgi:hypothetical protein
VIRQLGVLAIVSIGTFIMEASQASSNVLSASAVCRIASERGKHIGETITFRGIYASDHIERSAIFFRNCVAGVRILRIGIDNVSPSAEKQIDQADRPPWTLDKHIYAIFTAKLVQSARNNFLYANDDGVRFDVIQVKGISLIPSIFPKLQQINKPLTKSD